MFETKTLILIFAMALTHCTTNTAGDLPLRLQTRSVVSSKATPRRDATNPHACRLLVASGNTLSYAVLGSVSKPYTLDHQHGWGLHPPAHWEPPSLDSESPKTVKVVERLPNPHASWCKKHNTTKPVRTPPSDFALSRN